ncbi:MAG: PQQ-dependent sugar dehydrogenase [Candidatus Krumholzibacteriia bacterium]
MSIKPSQLAAPVITCLIGLITGVATAAPSVELVTDALSTPIRVTAPTGDDRLFVVEQTGLIRVFDQDGTDRGIFLDWTGETTPGGERGLLGLAFDPRYPTTGRFYINYTDNGGDTRVARLRVDPADPDRALAGSVEPILFVAQPYSNHNGGQLVFGPDRMLYVGLGDGGSGGDPDGNGQNGQTLLGAMLRLDVSGVGPGYAIPVDNPFVGNPAVRDEIWALGVRNPWCYGFDRLTGDLYIADVGQGDYEEVNVQPAASSGGENYGWRIMEGAHCFSPPDGCNQAGLTLPVHEYTHGGNPFRCSISGGFVHRGGTVPDLAGRYLFADYCSNQIWSLDWTAADGLGAVIDHTATLTPPGGYNSLVSIGEDGHGDLYVVDRGGSFWRIIEDTASAVDLPPPGDRLLGAHPNPFNPQTELVFELRAAGPISLTVHDLAGRRLATAAGGVYGAGEHRVTWDGRDARGGALASGVYLVRLSTPASVSTRKVTLAR